jgi:ATP-binding cassette subfamily G (WHITE) protein 2 (SNQ2)
MDMRKGKESIQTTGSAQGDQQHTATLTAQSSPPYVSDKHNGPTAPPAARRVKTFNVAEQGHDHRPPDSNALRRSHSHVSVDFFDPRGVRRLTRALSHISDVEPISSLEDTEASREESERRASEGTLTSDEQFDFEKAVREYLKKYVSYTRLS